MKYKVGDRVTCNGLSGIVFRVDDLGYYELLIEFENGNRTWFNSDDVSPDYRALYEQEKALREAAEKMLCDQADMKIDEWMEAFDNYQQLKQQYGQDTGTPR